MHASAPARGLRARPAPPGPAPCWAAAALSTAHAAPPPLPLRAHSLVLRWPDGGRPEVARDAGALDCRALWALEAATKRRALQVLSLRGCVLGPWGAHFVANGVRAAGGASRLEVLRLNACRLRAEGCSTVATLLSLEGSPLAELELEDNAVGDAGLAKLAEALGANVSLEVLILKRNRIGPARLPALATAVAAHPSLRVLDLGHNRIGYRGCAALSDALRGSSSLQKLYLAHNALRSDALWRLASVSVGHESLLLLDLRGIRLAAAERARLMERVTLGGLELRTSR